MITIQLPAQLASLAEGKKFLTVEAKSLSEVFCKIDEVAPMLRSQIFDANGAIRQFMGIFVNGNQIDEIGEAIVPDDSNILIVMAVAGG